MRTSKKFLSMILAVIMIVGTFSAVASSYAFDDVEDYQNQIALMSELKIVEGYDETTFGYGEDVQRWQMALWIAKIMTGKVYDAYVNWYSTENYTNFTDINPDQFYGSISYGVENGIILGKSDVSFDPTAGITFQEAFTMVVRMLGYGSSAMDATYPWSYVDKAIKLGLDDGLRADYNNEEVATREEIVVILYNALFAPKADGTTFGENNFNLVMDTVVLTGTSRGQMFTDAANPSKVAADGSNYVTFNLLGEDGKVLANPSYYLPRSAFAPFLDSDDLAATLKIGYSYDVVTKDGYTTLLYAKENDTVVVDQDYLKGGTDSATTAVTIGSDAYKAVTAYSVLGNNQGTKTTNDFEIILYKLTGNAAIGSASYLRNSQLDIINKDLNVILKWIPHSLTGATTPYPDGVYMAPILDKNGIPTGAYRDPVEADWIKAAEAAVWAIPDNTKTLYQAITNTYTDITLVNAYADTILIDDDGDSDYDRGIYIYYSFGKIGVNGDGYLTSDAAGVLDKANKASAYKYIDVDKYFAGEEYEIKQDDVVGKYCLYAVNNVTKVFYLKKTYDVKIGYVTTVNKPAKTITFDQVYYGYNAGNITGSTYTVGVPTLPGGTYNAVLASYTDFDTLKGRTVNYVLDEKYSAILRIVDYGNDAGYVVIKDTVASINTNGYANVLAYVNSNIASVITVASIDGYTNVNGASLVNMFVPGDLFKATKDALGMYHLTYIDPQNFTYYAEQANYAKLGINFTNGVAYTDEQATQVVYLDANGKPTTDATTVNYDDRNGVSKAFSNFGTDKNTVIILVSTTAPYTYSYSQIVDNGYVPTLDFEAIKGVPADGSHITLEDAFDYGWRQNKIQGARIFEALDGDGNADFIYVVDGYWDSIPAVNPASSQNYLDSNDTIIYVDAHTMESMVATNQTSTGLGVSVGTVYKYTNAIDFIRGGITDAYTGAMYNQRLYAGHFYYVEDGYVVGEAFVGASGQIEPTLDTPKYDIEVVKVSYVDKFVSVYTKWDGTVNSGTGSGLWTSSFGKPIVYELGHDNADYSYVGKDVYVTYKDGKPKDIVDDFAKIVNEPGSYATAYVYTGALNNRTYSNQKTLFITTTYTDAKSKAVVHDLGSTLTNQNLAYLDKAADGTILNTTTNGIVNNSAFAASIKAAGAKYVWEITAAQYVALSAFYVNYNDVSNIPNASIQNIMKAYIKDTEIDITVGSKITFFVTYVEQGIGNKYYLGITSVGTNAFDCIAGKPLYLVWNNPENTNETYKLHLCGAGTI